MSAGNTFKTVMATVAMAALLGLTGCATGGNSTNGEIADPAESVNRGIFKFNDAVDSVTLKPIAQGYRAAVPKPVRTSVRNFLRNLESPVIVANQALQGDVEGTAASTMRALINTTIGIGGLFDVAAEAGIPHEDEDFGQTLAVWGLDHGAYVVLPIIGPSSVRDATGLAVDTIADPVNIWLDNTGHEDLIVARIAARAIDMREEYLDLTTDLKKNSVDYYAAMRSTYVQYRAAAVSDQSSNGATVDIPEY
ncbi:MAG: VacJ family lipoprotein [Pseudomonadota bacterium]